MPTIKMTLVEAKARTLTAADKTRLAKLANKPDSEIDFDEQPEITDAAIAAGHFRVVGRGGKREGRRPPRPWQNPQNRKTFARRRATTGVPEKGSGCYADTIYKIK
jgi:hypothetical protein